jgi:hypothetical protein
MQAGEVVLLMSGYVGGAVAGWCARKGFRKRNRT